MTKIYSMKNKHPERQPQKAILLTEVSKWPHEMMLLSSPVLNYYEKNPPTLRNERVGGFVSLTY